MSLRPGLATIVSVRPWEEQLTRAATASAAVRLVGRLATPLDVARRLASIDILVIGAETPWLEEWVPPALDNLGVATIGVHPPGDAPAGRLLAGAALRFPDDTDVGSILRAAIVLADQPAVPSDVSRLTSAPHTHL